MAEPKQYQPVDRGFTIVELLIVIVIIGILAALVIMTYNGVQKRAIAVGYQTDALLIVKKMEAYYTNIGYYPVTNTTATGTVSAATVVALMNASNTEESNLPSKATIYSVNAANTAPTYAQAVAATPVNDSYYVAYCATGGGVNVYYPDPYNSSIKTASAGKCP